VGRHGVVDRIRTLRGCDLRNTLPRQQQSPVLRETDRLSILSPAAPNERFQHIVCL
jgi:hypothetical protein